MPHIHEKIDFTSEVFIVHNGKVLLRKHDKYKLWLSVGGHIELDQDPNQAAIIEAKEEVGLDIELYRDPNIPFIEMEGFQEIVPPQSMNRHRINPTHEHVTLVYFARSLTDELKLSATEKTEECKWFSLEELDSEKYEINDYVKFYAKSALKKLAC